MGDILEKFRDACTLPPSSSLPLQHPLPNSQFHKKQNSLLHTPTRLSKLPPHQLNRHSHLRLSALHRIAAVNAGKDSREEPESAPGQQRNQIGLRDALDQR